MKKILLLLLGLLIIIGILLFWVTNTNKRVNLNTATINSLTTKKISLNNPHAVNFSIRTAIVEIKSGSSPQLKLTNISNNQYKIIQNQHSLTIAEKNANTHQIEIGKSPTITLILPQKDLSSLKIDQLNGTLKLNNLIVNQFDVFHHNGTTLANNLTITKNGQFTKNNGSTTLNHLIVSGLAVDVKTGQFQLNGQKQKNHYRQNAGTGLTINSGSGQVKVNR